MTSQDELDHALKNHLAILIGYCELLLQECQPDDPRRGDFEEMHRAALAAVRLVAARQEDGE
jgi:hypothetical protein